MKRSVLLVLLCFGAAAASVSEASVLLEEKSPVYVNTRDSRSWKFPAVDPRAGRVVVEFRNRIDYPKLQKRYDEIKGEAEIQRMINEASEPLL